MELNIKYILSLEDSPRVRAACVIYLQNWLSSFYPERPDLVEKAQQLAKELGGNLTPPQLSWKYSWIRALFGWNAAKMAQLRYNEIKEASIRRWDKLMYDLEPSRTAKAPEV